MEEIDDKLPILVKDLGMMFAMENSSRKYRFGLYKCGYCGKEFRVMANSVKTKHTKSCGCLRGKEHNLTKHRLYNTWHRINYRCTNPNSQDYPDYGARGILVCEEWQDVKNFIEWVDSTHPNIEGYTLDRIDNDGNYEPSNCRWADRTTQVCNQRMKKSNKSGFVGVFFDKLQNKWVASVRFNSKQIHIGRFKTIEEAVEVRDNYIIQNKLPHKLSSEYKKELE